MIMTMRSADQLVKWLTYNYNYTYTLHVAPPYMYAQVIVIKAYNLQLTMHK